MDVPAVSIGILSLGCPKNLVDSEVLLGYLREKGFRISFDVTACDVALINTCSFVDDARQESLDMIDELITLKREGKIRHIIVCGCLPQRYPQGIEGYKDMIDGYVGTGEIPHIADIVDSVLRTEKTVACETPTFLYSDTTPRFFLTPPFVKYVKIAEGCNHACSFCVIPRLRGNYRSRAISSIVAEVTALVDQGLREVVLVAQDSSAYGMDLGGTERLADLLSALAGIEGLSWIRPLYLHPRHITKELIAVIKTHRQICNYIDIPLQHINNDILRSMRRGITRDEIVDLIHMIRREIEGVVIRTAFIIGYPGEGYQEFNELLDFIDEMSFDRLGAFIYSREEGSPAAELDDTVSLDIKKSRFQDIMMLQQKISREKNKQLKNKVFETLIEGYNEDKKGYFIGRTYMDAPEVDGCVYIKKKKGIEIGKMYPVKMIDTFEYDLLGTVV